MHHTSAYVSIRQHTAAYVSIRPMPLRQLHNLYTCSIRQHTSAYVSIRQHTAAYGSIRPMPLEQLDNLVLVGEVCAGSVLSGYAAVTGIAGDVRH